MTLTPPERALATLRVQERGCTRCPLRQACNQVVPGNGSPTATMMFVGEAPGADEDRRGTPFVGPSGELLNRMLGMAGLTRDEVFVSNCIRCRPPRNRTPKPAEIAACKSWLWEEMRVVKPIVVVTLGRTPAALLLKHRWSSMQDILERGFAAPYLAGGDGMIVPLYHPSYLLRTKTTDLERIVSVIVRARDYARAHAPTAC